MQSSGNVFADLDVEHPEEELAKAQLAHRVRTLIQARGLTQTQVAKLVGTDQARVSELINGRISGFTFDRLFRFLTALNAPVEIRLPSSKDSPSSATITVHAD